MKRRKLRKAGSVLSAAVLTAALALGAVNADSFTAEAESASGDVLAAFENPDKDAKPMVRWWFPDAGAGEDEDDLIEEYITAMADAGYGGVEISMLNTGTAMDNEDLADYGWGSENYVKLLKKVLTVANSIEGGFTVDITITAHWPTVINNVDPNDEAAAQELVYTTQAAQIDEDGNISLELPDTKLRDVTNGLPKAAFIFTDTLVDTYLIKANTDGTYDYDTAINVTDYIVSSYGYAAGVPDEEAFAEWYADEFSDMDLDEAYQTYVIDIYGEAPADDADLSKSYNGKQDSEGNRARMADTQYYYTLDTTKLSEDIQTAIADGEYTLVNTYTRGTGQVMSDGMMSSGSDMMVNRTYTTNYFTEDGTNALIDYWEENILDEELRALLQENGSSIFEDSIEASTSSGGSFWSNTVISRFAQDYGDETAEYLPLIVALSGSLTSDEISISDAQTSFQITLGNLYEEVHSEEISDWASTFGYSYRAQCYQLTGQDITGSELAVDIPEGDNASKGDGLRTMASVVNLDDKDALSMEAVTASSIGQLNWADVVTEVSQNYSDGVNHVVLHGSGYEKSVTGYATAWPGWQAFGGANGDSYSTWRCDFDDMDNLTGFMARTQAVLQEGTAKIDILFLKDTSNGANLGSGNSFQQLLNEGFSYNMATEAIFESENAVVSNNVLAEDGPAYKALVLNSVSQISSEAMEKIVEYAKAGLPVVLYNTNVSDIYGLETDTNTVDALLEAYAELQTLDNVKTASTETELISVLAQLGVTSDASTADGTEYLEITHYEDDSNGSDYYYMFNNPSGMTNNTGFVSAGQSESYKAGDSITTEVTLTGEGVPYELDAWTGEITPIAAYTVNDDGTVTVEVTLDGGDSTIIALLVEKDETLHVTGADENVEYDSDGNLVYKSNEAGTTELSLSDGSTAEVTIESELETLDLSTGWKLTIESYAESDSLNDEDNIAYESKAGYIVYKDPTLTDITTVEFDIDTLTLWADIEASDEQLEELGVDSMSDISGLGYYTNTFTLPEGWSDTTGAVVEIEYNSDMIISVTVNGNVISSVNNVSDKVDIGEYLQTGENTIEIKMSTVMANAISAASSNEAASVSVSTLAEDDTETDDAETDDTVTDDTTWSDSWSWPESDFSGGFGSSSVDCGITSVTLTPYTAVEITSSGEDNSGLTAAKEAAEAALAALEPYLTVDSLTSDTLADAEAALKAAEDAVDAYEVLGGTASELTGYENLAAAQAAWDAYWKAVEDAEALEKELAAAKEAANAAIAALADYQEEGSITSDNYADAVILVETAKAAVETYQQLGGSTDDLTDYAFIAAAEEVLAAYAAGQEQEEILAAAKAAAEGALAALADYQEITADNYDAALKAVTDAGYLVNVYLELGGTADDLADYANLETVTAAIKAYTDSLEEGDDTGDSDTDNNSGDDTGSGDEDDDSGSADDNSNDSGSADDTDSGSGSADGSGSAGESGSGSAVEDTDDTDGSDGTDDTEDTDDSDDTEDADDTDDSDDAAAADDSSDSGSSGTAKTGDTSTAAVYVVIICIAAAAAAAVLIRRKKSMNV